MQIKTKGDLVRAALRKLGVASDATLTDVEPQSMQDAVDDLEAMMAEWYQDGKGIITGYVFSDDDNPPAEGDDHGLDPVQSAPYSIIWPAALLLIMRLRLLPKLSPLLNMGRSFSISRPPSPELNERLTRHVCQQAVETVSPI